MGIFRYPFPLLREKCQPVEVFDQDLRDIAGGMLGTLQRAQGWGLAAPQVGLLIRMIVVHVPTEHATHMTAGGLIPASEHRTDSPQPAVLVNPAISDLAGEPYAYDEGCLSLPGIVGTVMRQPELTIRAQTLDGKPWETRVGGLLARVLQHECDHLDGVLILDRFTRASRRRLKPQIAALEATNLPTVDRAAAPASAAGSASPR